MIPYLGYLAGRFFKMHIYCNQFSLPTLAKREALFQDGVWNKIFSCAHVVFLSLLLLGVNKNNLSLEKKKNLPVWQNITN